MKCDCSWPSKKDLVYWIIFLVVFHFFNITASLAKDIKLVEYIGFAGNVTSIILGVIAILYSFYQNQTTVNASDKLDQSIKLLTEASSRVDTSVNQLHTISSVAMEVNSAASQVALASDDLKDLGNTIRDMQNNICATTVTGVEKVIKEILHKPDKNSPPINDLKKIDKAVLAKLILSGTPSLVDYFLYTALKLSEHKLQMDYSIYGRVYNEFRANVTEFSPWDNGFTNGYAFLLDSLDLMTWLGDEDISFAPELKNEILQQRSTYEKEFAFIDQQIEEHLAKHNQNPSN